jgi:hypothetical protein
MSWTAPPLGPNRPGSLAQRTLPAPRAESSNPSRATGGFRMFRIHACKLPHAQNDS